MALKAPQPTADELADSCLAYMVHNPEHLAEFMGVTGLTPGALRSASANGSLAPGLIDYVAQNEPLLLAICAEAAITPDSFMRVWSRLNPAG